MVPILTVLLGATTVPAQTTFELLDPPGDSQWADFSLSRDGRSMGCLVGGAVYWWTATGGYRYLDAGSPAGSGVGMSADGTALAAAKSGPDGGVPAIWYRNGTSVTLGSMTGDCDRRHPADGAFDLSNGGAVVVGQAADCNDDIGFVWSRTSGLRELGDHTDGASRGSAVSADGHVVVGFSEHSTGGYRRPSLWHDGTGPVLFLGPNRSGEALGVSLDGTQVVGQADLGGPLPEAFYWTENEGPVGLGSLDGLAADRSVARAVSDDGKVVGWSGDVLWGNQEAFIWTAAGGMRSLAAVLEANGVALPAGMTLTRALDISGDGSTVVGICRDRDWTRCYWRIRLAEDTILAPVAGIATPDDRPAADRPDTMKVQRAGALNPYPFGKRRYDEMP